MKIKTIITETEIASAITVLANNGIEASEAGTVMQAIGAVMLDADLDCEDTERMQEFGAYEINCIVTKFGISNTLKVLTDNEVPKENAEVVLKQVWTALFGTTYDYDKVDSIEDTETLKYLLRKAIIGWFDDSFTDYGSLDDEEFIHAVCKATGLSRKEYKEVMA